MKITIEIPDEALRNAVEAQVGIALSALTRETIDRVVSDALGSTSYARNNAVTRLVQEAALQAIKGSK